MGVRFHHGPSSGALMRMRKVDFRSGLHCRTCGCLRSLPSARRKDAADSSDSGGQQLSLSFDELQKYVRSALSSYGVPNNVARGKKCNDLAHSHLNDVSIDESRPIRFFQVSDLLEILNVDAQTKHLFHNSYLHLTRDICQIYSEPINLNSLFIYDQDSAFVFHAALRRRTLSHETESQLMYLECSHLFPQLKEFAHISDIQPEFPVHEWEWADVALDTPSRLIVFEDHEIASQSIVYSDNLNLIAHR